MLHTCCPKCGYIRKAHEEAPEWQCPNCQVAYNKAIAAKQQETAKAQAPKPEPPPEKPPQPTQAEPQQPTKPNKNLSECKACNNPVSKKAKTCPHCGQKKPAKSPGVSAGNILILLIVVPIMFIWIFAANAPSTSTGSSTASAECQQDIQCLGDKKLLEATIACEPLIQGHAKYAHEWTDGFTGAKFNRFAWNDQPGGIIAYFGDKIKFQNGFGAWQNAEYKCIYNTQNKTVVEATVF